MAAVGGANRGVATVTTDDVAKLVTDRLAAVAAVGTYVPGGCFFGTGPDTPTGYPYGVFQVTAEPARGSFGGHYLQAFTVRLAAYAPVGASGVDPQEVSRAFDAALTTSAAGTALQATALRSAAERVLHCRPVSPDGGFEERLRDARDVFVCGCSVELLTQGSRGVN